jgi:phosphatidylglycerophosphate synthase
VTTVVHRVKLRVGSRLSAFYLAAARGLTLARLASIPLFLFLLVQTHRAGLQHWRMSLLLLYVGIALSDFFDGRLARKAGAPSHVWGQIDAMPPGWGMSGPGSRLG